MTELTVTAEISLEDAIASLRLADLTGDGRANIVLTTMSGSLVVYDYDGDARITRVAESGDLPPVAAMDYGDVLGTGENELVIGCIDNLLRIVKIVDGAMEIKGTTPLGTLPTAICVVNVVDDSSAEVVVATEDRALRCYGWFDVALDKLAHKVVDRPVFSIHKLQAEGVPYSRIIFGDDSEHIYLYQYADDRLHERARAKVRGEVQHVATGNLTESRTNDIIVCSDANILSLWRVEHSELERVDSVRAPSSITSICVGAFMEAEESQEQIVTSHANSAIALLTLTANRLVEVASTKTAEKSLESLVASGDLRGDGTVNIVQAVGKRLLILDLK